MEEEEAPTVVQLAAVWLSLGPPGHTGSSPHTRGDRVSKTHLKSEQTAGLDQGRATAPREACDILATVGPRRPTRSGGRLCVAAAFLCTQVSADIKVIPGSRFLLPRQKSDSMWDSKGWPARARSRPPRLQTFKVTATQSDTNLEVPTARLGSCLPGLSKLVKIEESRNT